MLWGLLPALAPALILAVAGVALATTAGALTGLLRRRLRWPVAYTRKAFHFIIFSVATVTQALTDMAHLNAFAGGVVLVVVAAVMRGNGDGFYESLARPRDAPRRSEFIIIPMLTTAAGGIVANLLAGPHAIVGYLVTGWGDAVGEPVGRRWGRHPYRVPGLWGVPAVRTIEGSAAVALASALAAWITLVAAFGATPAAALGIALLIGLATAAVEAVSHHGLDNFTTMVAAAMLAAWLG